MLSFRNEYYETVSLAVMWYNPGCSDGGSWEKKGWWNIAPGSTTHVLDLDLHTINRYYFFYARAANGQVWSGSFYTQVPERFFDWCYSTGSTDSSNLGFREIDIGDNTDFTLNLTT